MNFEELKDSTVENADIAVEIKEVVGEIKKLLPDLNDKHILGCVLLCLAIVMTTKRVTFSEAGKKSFPNIFLFLFLHSGMGKSQVIKCLKENILADFKEWFNIKAKNLFNKQKGEYNCSKKISGFTQEQIESEAIETSDDIFDLNFDNQQNPCPF